MKDAFPKSRRLRKRSDFLAVQRSGKSLHSRYFVVVYARSGQGRLGITVSKKVGKAVSRNRVKRLVREFVRRTGPDRPGCRGKAWVPENLDVVVIAKRAAARASAAELWSDLARQQQRLSQAALLQESAS